MLPCMRKMEMCNLCLYIECCKQKSQVVAFIIYSSNVPLAYNTLYHFFITDYCKMMYPSETKSKYSAAYKFCFNSVPKNLI